MSGGIQLQLPKWLEVPKNKEELVVLRITPFASMVASVNKILLWVSDTNFDVDFLGYWYDGDDFFHAYKIPSPNDRTMFVLRWQQ